VRVLFATAELAPVAVVGGLAAATSGLVRELRRQGIDVEVVLPDYTGLPLEDETALSLDVPGWAAPARARRGSNAAVGPLTLVSVPGIERPHPYTDETGEGWPDNDRRFLGFAAAVAALARATRPEVLHLNDWHTAAALAATPAVQTSVLSIHNLAFQGWAAPEWAERLGERGAAYLRGSTTNPLAGAVSLADAVVTVSPTYRDEILTPALGCGLDHLLREHEAKLTGIINGIDTEVWDPATDPHLPETYDADDVEGKAAVRAAALERVGLPDGPGPLLAIVSRLSEQKGIDLLLPALDELPALGARLAVLGAGDRALASELHAAAHRLPDRVAFVEGYDDALSHLLSAGADLLLVPSRFEPCGLTQMQAMRYGTLPVVTDVGGLHDTVADLDAEPDRGTGWKAAAAEPEAVADAVRRAVRGWSDPALRRAAQRRGMSTDWSWSGPAAEYAETYRRVLAAR
jgi:starch synthase